MDVLSRVAKVRYGVQVGRLAEAEGEDGQLDEALAANTRTRVPEQVAFRQDFPRWRAELNVRDRGGGGRPPGRGRDRGGGRPVRDQPGTVSQLRREFTSN